MSLDCRDRRRWLLYDTFTIRKATHGKSIRITWGDGKTNVEVLFNSKGDSKCQVVVQHNKLADADQAEVMKSYWREALSRLQYVVAASRSVRPGG
ncbi:MAG: SRPBCC domain-containing protein [Dehalococcoidia bacterium]|nr:SRPBCC domain-containing protein [Dehalococcoidia bacterium]